MKYLDYYIGGDSMLKNIQIVEAVDFIEISP